MPPVRVVGIDLVIQLIHVVEMDDTGTIVWRKRFARSSLRPSIA
jgi:hypothetical protein